jgi:hypothetical protein
MQDAKGKEAGGLKVGEKQELKERKSEATSDETVSDLEETETDSSSTDTGLDPGPSPDGLLDERDEVKDGGPM